MRAFSKVLNSLWKIAKYSSVDVVIPAIARQPKLRNTCAMSQCHGPDTITMGGAAKWVSVPPTETLTKRSPMVAYLSRIEGL